MSSVPGLLLVDDDAELCGLMCEFFSEQGLPLTAAHDGRAGLDLARTGRFDLILLDVMMPGLDGFEVLRRLRESSEVPVLMLTARTDAASRIHGLNTGADDYLPKPFDPHELVARVRAILRRSKTPPSKSEMIEASGVKLHPGTRRVELLGQPVDLTSVEYEILESLMRSAGSVVSRDDLTQRLYQRESTPYDRAIDVHISHLRKKLECGRQLIVTVRGTGYQFCTD